jgi:hypothetical protein
MNCNDCFYYEEYEVGKGFCHRNPPDNGIARVTINWWCGEFRNKTDVIPIGVMGKKASGQSGNYPNK